MKQSVIPSVPKGEKESFQLHHEEPGHHGMKPQVEHEAHVECLGSDTLCSKRKKN